ncbi:hypothetical protein LCGC14_2907590, partial [marine sediment metagenome]
GREEDEPTRRQVVKFTLYRVDPAWRSLPRQQREKAKGELCRAVESFGDRLLIRSYSLMGMRGDADFMLWQVGDRLEGIQELATAVFSTAMGPHLSVPYSYLAMTRRSIYVPSTSLRTGSPEEEGGPASHTVLSPGDAGYLFVYPFVKTRAWYKLSKDERQRMMDEHIGIGRKYPSVKLNTTYSYGLDDQEFVVAFETDEPADFLDLVMELRETEASSYTLSDTPIFSCIAMGLREAGFAVDATGDGQEGLWYAMGNDYDVIILDLMLPGMDGLEILKKLRAKDRQNPVLILTAKDTLQDRVTGLDLGADDHLVKPFEFSELLARLRALTRRRYQHKHPRIQIEDLRIDLTEQRVWRGRHELQLTPREYALLEYLAMRAGQTVSG